MGAIEEEFPLIPDEFFLVLCHMPDFPYSTLLFLMPPISVLATVHFAICCVNSLTELMVLRDV